ncbi:ATP-binding cassette domain-containing protein, partial [Rhizobium ruizarguesonis]
ELHMFAKLLVERTDRLVHQHELRLEDEITERVRRALDMVRMASFETRRPNKLSGGQQQRIALARALVFEPQLVLMEETLGALEKKLREHMQLEIKHLHARLG